MAVKSVAMASDLCGEVQFSAEDASRTEPEFLAEIVESVIDAGAAVINIPDTVGFTMPEEYFRLISYLKSHVPNVDRIRLSVHCHDDMGMAVANSLAAIRAGARQIEGTINGIGERAGNTALEEVIMALHSRRDFFSEVRTGVRTNELVRTSRMVAAMSGLAVPRSKAVVGANAFAHGSGIHQDGVLKNRSTYEVMDPEEIGWGATELPLTKHSGRHAVKMRLSALGLSVPDTDMPRLFELFKKRGDQCKFVYDDDLAALVDSPLSMNFHYPEIPHGISGWLLYLYGDVFGMDLPTGEFAGSRFEAPSYAGGKQGVFNRSLFFCTGKNPLQVKNLQGVIW